MGSEPSNSNTTMMTMISSNTRLQSRMFRNQVDANGPLHVFHIKKCARNFFSTQHPKPVKELLTRLEGCR